MPAALSSLRRASMTVTVIVLNDVAVGIDRDSSMYLASIAAPPLRGWRSAEVAAAPLPPLRTSALVMRPRGPLPVTDERSTPSLAAIRAATGGPLLAPLSGGWA